MGCNLKGLSANVINSDLILSYSEIYTMNSFHQNTVVTEWSSIIIDASFVIQIHFAWIVTN